MAENEYIYPCTAHCTEQSANVRWGEIRKYEEYDGDEEQRKQEQQTKHETKDQTLNMQTHPVESKGNCIGYRGHNGCKYDARSTGGMNTVQHRAYTEITN